LPGSATNLPKRLSAPGATDLSGQPRGARGDRIGVDRVLRLHPERPAQRLRLGTRRGDAAERHVLQPVERAGLGGEHDERLGTGLDPRRHARVVIAFAAQQRLEKVGVLARAAIELRGIGGGAVVGVERRQFLEALAQQRRRAGVDTVDPPIVAPFGGTVGRRRGRSAGGVGAELGPGDADVGQRRERRIGVERRRVRRHGLRRGLSGKKEHGSRAKPEPPQTQQHGAVLARGGCSQQSHFRRVCARSGAHIARPGAARPRMRARPRLRLRGNAARGHASTCSPMKGTP
jgi:hypothetical protein